MTMTQQRPEVDGYLPGALREFTDAISDLIDVRHQLAGRHDCKQCHTPDCLPTCSVHQCIGHPTPVQPLYLQLYDAVGSGRTGAAQDMGLATTGSNPIWLNAFVILDEIDTAVEVWQPIHTGAPATVGRLRAMLAARYRPQDVRGLEQKTDAFRVWKRQIEELFNPPRKWHIAKPCPNCRTATVYRKDSAGETVRQPALSLGVDACECLACHYIWQPYRFHLLADALDCPLPDGVLE